MDHLLNNCETVFWDDFLEKLKQFSGRGSKMDCLLKKRCISRSFSKSKSKFNMNIFTEAEV